MKKLPDSNWISKALYDSNPGFGAVVSLTFGDDKRSFFHTRRGWMVDDDFDYNAIAQNTVPTAIGVIYEGLTESDFEPGDQFSPNGRTYTYLPQQNWKEV